jgi:predicted GNAT family N-acyltransferase
LRSSKQTYSFPVRIETKEISPAEVLPLRSQILRPGRPIEECIWPGDDWPDSIHLGALVEGQLAGIASFYREAHPQLSAQLPYRLRGMATVESMRNQHLGTRLLKFGIHKIRDAGADLVWCNARVGVVGFYLRQGFIQVGEPFDMPTVGPHVLMYRNLSGEN